MILDAGIFSIRARSFPRDEMSWWFIYILYIDNILVYVSKDLCQKSLLVSYSVKYYLSFIVDYRNFNYD